MVMPVFSPRQDWLLRAVDGALRQSCSIELIVVDDGSPEPVAGLLAGGDPRVRVTRIEHGGEGAARNAGIAAARGDLIRFVDADDVVAPDSCGRLAAVNAGRPDVIAYGDTMHCDADLRPIWRMVERRRGHIAEQALVGDFNVRVFSMVFPRSVVSAAGPWDEVMGLGTDWDFLLRALEYAAVEPESGVATYYRRHEGSMTGRQRLEAEARNAAIVDRWFARHPDQRGSRLERRSRANVVAIGARVQLGAGRPLPALRSLGRALRLSPAGTLTQFRLSVRALRSRAGLAVRPGRPVP
jgi:glycosyltransferase involved in cell wall biosynthesis